MGCCTGKRKAVSPTHKHDVYRSRTPVPERNDSPRVSTPQQDYSAMQRMNKIAVTSTNPLPLMNGYLDEPLMSLEEALKPVDGRIDHLSNYIKEAKTKCHYPSEHNLTRDESAAIYIYTMKWDNRCVYNQLQAAFNSGDRSQLLPWFKYLKLFRTALDKLPNATTGAWQGTSFDDRLNEKLSSQSATLFTSFGSCSPSDDEIKNYLQKNSGAKTMLINYESINGKSVTGYTASKSQEILLWPGMKLGVSKYAVVDANGSVIVHLVRRTDPPKRKKIQSTEKHFVCANHCCDNKHCPNIRSSNLLLFIRTYIVMSKICENIHRCRGNHKPDHCYGFASLQN